MHLLQVVVVAHDPASMRSISIVLDRSLDRGLLDIRYFVDSADALDWIQASNCELVITALEMPGIDGLRLVRAAKQGNAHTQVIVVSPQTTSEQLDELAELGACDILLQPLDKLLLRELVEQAIARIRRWQSALNQVRKPVLV